MPKKPSTPAKAPVTPAEPTGLSARASAFWGRTVADFELSDAETELLVEAALTMTEIDALRELLADGLSVPGSMGQPRVHPAVNEVRQHRVLLARLLKALDLPDEDEKPETQTTRDARAAANRRWQMARQRDAAHG